ncbi:MULTISPECIES: hypothetical protein [unclassified Streptomyces]|uniref:hypothetical protein n=1 Tax=unclassified Streptomyces TaxID=2593676 RepID=UPI002E2C1EFE|nr:hypothetical protein [Streptomyces sp. NBC_01423]WSX93809.1 DUF11 domain-containing protein [Streptomyces sp. NBC_00891]WSY08287.1 DUF11 domain-containing protein [Streptomyces sp. NBC_00890]WSZ09910.1 DUF11 domain-containing protein [Streptomyces sp. NBC_00869]WSZ22588.1 DUF11 domain-containing protein [Streptomyces sp. NBC_00870]
MKRPASPSIPYRRPRGAARVRTLCLAFLLAVAGVQFMVSPAHAVSAVSVSSTTVAAGETFTIDFTGTADTPRTGAGENFYAGSTDLGSLDAFTSIESCTGNTAPCTEVAEFGPRVPLGDLAGGESFAGSITLRVDPETPAGTFVLRYQLYANGGEATADGPTITVTNTPAEADLDVGLSAQPRVGILVPHLSYTLRTRDNGPDDASGVTVTATLPGGKTATGLSAGCTSAPGTVTCTYGSIAEGGEAVSTFRLPIGLLDIGPVVVTATRTASAPDDPNAANDTAGAACTVLSIALANCA